MKVLVLEVEDDGKDLRRDGVYAHGILLTV